MTGGVIPSLQHKARVVDNVVEVQVREQGVRYIDRALACFQHAVSGPGTVIKYNDVITNFEQVT
jgi:hypothetical protein